MAHFAQVDDNNIVIRVLVISGEEVNSGRWGDPTKWIKTSYNTRGGVYFTPNTNKVDPDQSKALRKNFAQIGYAYDPQLDAFIPPSPYPSWVLNTEKCLWETPVPKPKRPWPDGVAGWVWDERTVSWVPTDKDPLIPEKLFSPTIL